PSERLGQGWFVYVGSGYRALSLFFRAQDGIRDSHVTGVQTCALPICLLKLSPQQQNKGLRVRGDRTPHGVAYPTETRSTRDRHALDRFVYLGRLVLCGLSREIGRASCRERVVVAGGEGSVKQ